MNKKLIIALCITGSMAQAGFMRNLKGSLNPVAAAVARSYHNATGRDSVFHQIVNELAKEARNRHPNGVSLYGKMRPWIGGSFKSDGFVTEQNGRVRRIEHLGGFAMPHSAFCEVERLDPTGIRPAVIEYWASLKGNPNFRVATSHTDDTDDYC